MLKALLSVFAVLLVAPLPLHAQEVQAVEGRELRIEDLPPPVRLGARAETVRRAWPVLPVVVVVADERSYLEALAHWRPDARFPVLIDDKEAQTREDIARFVRAFQPRSVVRWSADFQDDAAAEWPDDAGSRRARIESTLHRIWSSPLPGEGHVETINSTEQLIARWQQIGVVPPGVVFADPADDAWPAAVALAAGRLQPLAWVESQGQFGGTLNASGYQRLAVEIERQVGDLGLQWRALGDQIDALTICLNIPAKVRLDNETLATTDLLGRHRPSSGEAPEEAWRSGERWAWAGQIAGTKARAAYSAMCSLFLVPESAWLFDGYSNEEPWSRYSASEAGEFLGRADLDIVLDTAPRHGKEQWRRRAVGGISAGFIAVNTRGNGDEFHLAPGRALPGDVPHLNVPSFIYFVHSFSASSIGARETVGGRWLERGAFAYCGSVHEPFLHGFVPTPIVAARLIAAVPWGAAVRVDDGPAWKIAVIGDPLLALGPKAPRVGDDVSVPLARAVDYDDAFRAALGARNFAAALSFLTVLGRDDQVVRIAKALLADQPDAFSSEVADAALMSLFRADDLDSFIAAYLKLSPELSAAGWRRDALWHVAHPRLSGTRNRELLTLLAANLRPDQIGRDAAELAMPMARIIGRDEALAMLREALEATQSRGERQRIQEAISSIETPRRR